MRYTVDELKKICFKHIKWINNEKGGERADLFGANLSGASLSGASLSGADLSRADLSRASLFGANLSGADLFGANLSRANLSRADLSGASLSGASLFGASLSGANLSGADLFGADLFGANLSRANLSRANLFGTSLSGAKGAEHALAQTYICPEGSVIGWKKALNPEGGYCIVKLRIPEDSKRSNATGRKCRAEFADVLEIIGSEKAISHYDHNYIYEVGKRITANKFDENRWDESSNGIHFFITRSEAENYDL